MDNISKLTWWNRMKIKSANIRKNQATIDKSEENKNNATMKRFREESPQSNHQSKNGEKINYLMERIKVSTNRYVGSLASKNIIEPIINATTPPIPITPKLPINISAIVKVIPRNTRSKPT